MPDTAPEQLERVLYILAAAALPGGAEEAELSAALGVSPGQAARDLACLVDRAYYQAPGSAGGADILIDEGRIQVLPKGGLTRPSRLTAGEAAALALGLRAMALESAADAPRHARLLDLGRRMERFAARAAASPAIAADADLAGGEAVREALRRAAATRHACAIEYRKADGSRSRREVLPYALVHAERWWYLLAGGEGGERLFRIDRIAGAEVLDRRFELPEGFDPAKHLGEGRAFLAPGGAATAVVRYGPRAAAWVRERWTVEAEEPDGAVRVRHTVADPEWIVGHVLQYGADAELLEPAALRDAVRQRLEAVVEAWSG